MHFSFWMKSMKEANIRRSWGENLFSMFWLTFNWQCSFNSLFLLFLCNLQLAPINSSKITPALCTGAWRSKRVQRRTSFEIYGRDLQRGNHLSSCSQQFANKPQKIILIPLSLSSLFCNYSLSTSFLSLSFVISLLLFLLSFFLSSPFVSSCFLFQSFLRWTRIKCFSSQILQFRFSPPQMRSGCRTLRGIFIFDTKPGSSCL